MKDKRLREKLGVKDDFLGFLDWQDDSVVMRINDKINALISHLGLEYRYKESRIIKKRKGVK